MPFSISGLVSSSPAATYIPAPASAGPNQTAPSASQQTPPQVSVDTVKLSEYAQVNQLKNEGQTAEEIAAILGIPVNTVNSDLEIVAASANSSSAAGTTSVATDATNNAPATTSFAAAASSTSGTTTTAAAPATNNAPATTSATIPATRAVGA